MSEFKYACPVCGQHMMCDSSQSGTVMECPTCFQKIVAPQAPADPNSKFIITGSKFTEKKITATVQDRSIIEPPKKSSAALVIGMILGFMAAAAGVIYWTTIVHPRRTAKPAPVAMTNVVVAKPVVVAPVADDANWSLSLGTNAIAATPVAGRIHAQDFIVERASLSTNGVLTLRHPAGGKFEFGCTINFSGAPAESLAGRTIRVSSNADKAARVQLRWKDDAGTAQKKDFTNGYAMRLEFGPLANNKLPGKIHLCLPDAEKSYLVGAFTVNTPRPKVKN